MEGNHADRYTTDARCQLTETLKYLHFASQVSSLLPSQQAYSYRHLIYGECLWSYFAVFVVLLLSFLVIVVVVVIFRLYFPSILLRLDCSYPALEIKRSEILALPTYFYFPARYIKMRSFCVRSHQVVVVVVVMVIFTFTIYRVMLRLLLSRFRR